MKTKIWIILLAVLLALSLAAGLFLLSGGEDASRAEIWSDGELLYTLDLSVDQKLEIHCGSGVNEITVKDGSIAVTEANCPDGYCMDRGFCSGGTPIVCLPNKLVIEFTGEQAIDGLLG